MNINARVVAVFMSRKKGIPVNSSHFPFLSGAISVDDLDIGIASFGIKAGGAIQARMAIYQFIDGSMKFRHVISFNPETGNPIARPRATVGSRAIIEADRAMINWIKPLLFDDKTYDGGSYSWIDDPPVSIYDVDVEERRRIIGLSELTPNRGFFALERGIESSSEMVNRYISESGDLDKLISPQMFSLILSNLFEERGSPEGAQSISVPLADFRSMTVQKFSWGLRSQDGKFRDLRYGFLTFMNTVDRMIHKAASAALVSGTIKRSEKAFREEATEHLNSQKLDPLVFKKHYAAINSALQCLSRYQIDRDRGGIMMHGISHSSDAESENLMNGAFRDPTFLMARPIHSIQVLGDVNVPIEFPENGSPFFA